MQNENFYQAEEFLKLGLYPQAFEAFMSLEVGALDPTFLKPCMMALANQLDQGQLATLYDELEREVNRKNAQAIYNFGVVKSHVGDIPKATSLLQTAMDLGVPEARGALSRLLMR
jgi:TPR repeat protein